MTLKKLIIAVITLAGIIALLSSKTSSKTPVIVNKNSYMVVAEESEGDYSTIIAEVYRFNDEALILTYADVEKGEENIAARHEELFDKYGELVEVVDDSTLKIESWFVQSLTTA